jgi:hypothetical protein
MKILIAAVALVALSITVSVTQTPAQARSSGSHMSRHSMSVSSGAGGGLPTVPPSLTPDPRVVGSAAPSGGSARAGATKDDSGDKAVQAEDELLDKKIKSICVRC